MFQAQNETLGRLLLSVPCAAYLDSHRSLISRHTDRTAAFEMKNGRKVFIETLTELARDDPKIVLIIGDVGFRFIEDFRERFPNQFLNTGAAEQSMMGIAVGLSRSGWKPWVYTMIPFILFRPYEQVRNDICHGNSNVKLVGVQGSEAYKFLGMSHSAEEGEERNLLDKLPNIRTYLPEREEEIAPIMREEHQRIGPAYLHI